MRGRAVFRTAADDRARVGAPRVPEGGAVLRRRTGDRAGLDPTTAPTSPRAAQAMTPHTALLVGVRAVAFRTALSIRSRRYGELARARGVGLHVDACVGAFILPFLRDMGHAGAAVGDCLGAWRDVDVGTCTSTATPSRARPRCSIARPTCAGISSSSTRSGWADSSVRRACSARVTAASSPRRGRR